MEKALNIKLKDGSIVTKPCYIANQGTRYNAIPAKYLANLKYVNNKGEVETLLGTLTHTVFKEVTNPLITEFEFRFHDLTTARENSVVFVIMDEKETYAIGTANFVLNFLKEDIGEFSLKRKEGDFSPYSGPDVFCGEINLGTLTEVANLLEANKDLKLAFDLYEVIRKNLLVVSTDTKLREALLGDVICTPMDKTTADILIPKIARLVSLSKYGSAASNEVGVGKMCVIDLALSIAEGSMLFFDGVKWYHYTRGEQLFSYLLQVQKRLLNITKGSQLG